MTAMCVSGVATAALAEELDRRSKIAALDAYLAELDAELGPVADDDQAAARKWADQVFAAPPTSASTRPRQRRSV